MGLLLNVSAGGGLFRGVPDARRKLRSRVLCVSMV